MTNPGESYSTSRRFQDDRSYAGAIPPAKIRSGHQGGGPVDESIEANPEMMMDDKDILALIHRAEKEHPEQLYIRQTYQHCYEGVSLSEIAVLMDVPRSTAQGRIARTLKFLKQYINDQEAK